mgnify:CR=1 FL=1
MTAVMVRKMIAEAIAAERERTARIIRETADVYAVGTACDALRALSNRLLDLEVDR